MATPTEVDMATRCRCRHIRGLHNGVYHRGRCLDDIVIMGITHGRCMCSRFRPEEPHDER